MLIFRMETAGRVGMYQNDDSVYIINDGASCRRRWPMPADDERFVMNKKHHIEKHYPDNHMLKGPTMFHERCNDLRKCGLFKFYDEDLYRFGFGSYEQLDKWVSEFEWRKLLVEAKVYLNVYEIEEDFAILGYTQCTFRFDKATLLHSFIATSSESHIISTLLVKHPYSQSVQDTRNDFLL